MNDFLNQFPYSDFHELNLDWIIKKVKELQIEMQGFEAANTIKFIGVWNVTESYAAWSIVTDGTYSYISTKIVPAGIDIHNQDYWIIVGYFTVDMNLSVSSVNPIANKPVSEKFVALDDQIASMTSGINAQISSINTNIEGINDNIENIESEIDQNQEAIINEAAARSSADDLLSTRIDNIIALEPGSTTGDAELQDIRVGYNGYTYDTAGDAVRDQVSDIHDLLDSAIKFGSVGSLELGWLDGYYLVYANGNVGVNADFSIARKSVASTPGNLYPIKPHTLYTIKYRGELQYGTYNASYGYIEGYNVPAEDQVTIKKLTFTTPTNAAYIVISCRTDNVPVFEIFEGVYEEPSLVNDIYVPELLKVKNIAVTPSNYETVLPDLNNVITDSVYKAYFDTSSTNIPAHLPFSRWITNESVLIITIGKDNVQTSGSYAGTQQLVIGKNFVFVRHYTNEWKAWNAIKLNVRVGTANAGYGFAPQFSSLTEAVNFVTQYKNAVLEVGNGSYDLFTEFKAIYSNDFFDNFAASTTPKGLTLTNGVKIIGSSNSKIVFNYEGSNTHVKQQFSPINYLAGSIDGFTLENIIVECSNCRYCVHDDPGNTSGPYHNKYINCKFYIDNTNNDAWTSTKTIGGGLGQAGDIIIDKCLHIIADAESSNRAIVSYHPNVDTNAGSNKVTMTDCYLKGGTFAAFYGGNYCDFVITGNSMYGTIIQEKTPGIPDPLDPNTTVYAWNNVNRA